MAFARWSRTIQDEDGNVIPNVWCEVRDANAEGNPLAANLYSDRDGEDDLTNPFLAADGVPAFHVTGGCYHIRVYKTGLDETFEYVGIGTAQERDIVEGTGNVTGPDDSVDGEVAFFDGVTGKKIKGGGVLGDIWAASILALTGKTTPVDADLLGIVDSAAANAPKKLTFANLRTWIGAQLGSAINALTAKTTPVGADMVVIADSAASNASKKVTLANLGAGLAASQADQEAASSTSVLVTPGRQQFHPSAAKAWALVNGAGTSLLANYNVSGITDAGTGEITIAIGTDFSSANWGFSLTAAGTSSTPTNANTQAKDVYAHSQGVGAISAFCVDRTSVVSDPTSYSFIGFGDQ